MFVFIDTANFSFSLSHPATVHSFLQVMFGFKSVPFVVFLQTVQQRGAAVIKARKLSSAMSAAKAICDHMRDIWFGTKEVSVDAGCRSRTSTYTN